MQYWQAKLLSALWVKCWVGIASGIFNQLGSSIGYGYHLSYPPANPIRYKIWTLKSLQMNSSCGNFVIQRRRRLWPLLVEPHQQSVILSG